MKKLIVRNAIFFDTNFWAKAPDWARPAHKPKNRTKTSTMRLPEEVTLYDANGEYLFIQDGSEIGYAISENGIIEEMAFYPER